MKYSMPYPTMEEVESANYYQLALWQRFLPSPGMVLPGEKGRRPIDQEIEILNAIIARFRELGGMTPAISEAIGL